ncbi:hypothetical protein KEJ51_02320 [Candidatus Bathyarchaeota archaeon]|nr:hypothetical protein [Candidatus Bathyarchaeota archaeon]MBS7629043.1 hypothetical protein [Candidatus Bathyarchaeota archaeon]
MMGADVKALARVGLFELAFALSVVGALTLILIALLQLFGVADVIIPFYWLIPYRYIFPLAMGLSGDLLISVFCGIVALVSSRRIHIFKWAVLILISGIVAGGVGGTLIIVGGLIAITASLLD